MRLCAIGISLVLSTLIFTGLSFAAPKHMHDMSRRLYDRITTEFKHREYEAALAGFSLFMKIHSQSALAANAQYWIEECHYRMERYKEALNSFYSVVMNYPLSPKTAASVLKLGQTYTKLGVHDIAHVMFDHVIDQYLATSEAALARKATELTAEMY